MPQRGAAAGGGGGEDDGDLRLNGLSPGLGVTAQDREEGVAKTVNLGLAHARDVELGDYLGRVIPVKRGLGGGETVVVQGAGLLSDGEQVEVIP